MRLTLAFTLAVIALAIAFDAVQLARLGWPGTISYLALTQARRRPIIAVAIGVVIGHLFWPQTLPDPGDAAPSDTDDPATARLPRP